MTEFPGLARQEDNLLINDGRSFPSESESKKELFSDYCQRLGAFKLMAGKKIKKKNMNNYD